MHCNFDKLLSKTKLSLNQVISVYVTFQILSSRTLLALPALQNFDRAKIFLDEDLTAESKFTASVRLRCCFSQHRLNYFLFYFHHSVLFHVFPYKVLSFIIKFKFLCTIL